MANVNLNLDRVKGNSDVVQLVELGNGVVQITMKDEENRNAFSPGIIEGLYKCFGAVAQNKNYKVVVLTGYGNYFCSGGTKEELIGIYEREIKFNDLDFFRIALDCEIPVIAAMQGHSIGGGFVFGLYADLVVFSQESIYTTNFMKYGFTPGMGCTLIVPEKLGVFGYEMMYTAQNYRGKELAQRGIPFPVVPRKDVLKVAKKIAYEMSEKPRLSLITLKDHLRGKISQKLPEFVDKELAMHDITFHQPEVASRIEKIFGETTTMVDSLELNQKIVKQEREQINQQEEILNQLQLDEISLEKAEQMLLNLSEEKVKEKATINQPTNNSNKPIELDNSEELLSQFISGEISLETAEKLLLEEVVETNKKTENKNDIATTDIAIIGISCRYPGAKNRKEFWHNLTNGVESITEAPPGRWEQKNWYHPDPEHPGTSYSKYAGFLDEIDKFDPFFFEISPLEAEFMEPQQRIFLEEAYHAIEDAGYAPDSLKNQQFGIFVGVADSGYSKLLSDAGVGNNRLALTGNLPSMVSARIAYFLDTKGPVVAIDTACSSSLVAVHQACESIQRGESKLAIAGGIVIMTTADGQILSSQSQMISAEGHCKTFDAEASGTIWAEGCGVVLLKRYDQAIQDGDHIYGVIKGTGINYDGNTNGITAPSSQSQTSLEEGVYHKFGINPETISYVEAHGTATVLGDPIEVEALTNTFSKWTKKKQFCAIGTVKTNIGHAVYSAGISGLIKTALCLKNQKLVPSLNFNQANPHIDFENSPFYVNTELKDWKIPDGQIRRAVVSSFGLTGTNAHLVIEEAPLEVRSRRGEWPFARTEVRSDSTASVQEGNYLERSLHLLTLSAKTEKSLSDLVVSYQNYLEKENNDSELGDICYTANTGRTHFNHRLAVIASNQNELVEKLAQYEAGEEVAGICSGNLPNNITPPKIAFLFTGQGSQYVNMGKELYQKSSVFRKAINKCDEILGRLSVKSLLEILYPEDQDTSNSFLLNQTAYTQPAIFAIEYALAQVWQSWGIKPDIVMGHSVGEYVAATIAGIFSLEDGLKLIAERGRLMQELPPGGEMVAVIASESQVEKAISEYTSQVTIAAINGPESIVISGESEALASICSKLEAMGVKTKHLQVSHAFHSPLMEPMLAEFAAVAQSVIYNQPRIPLISNVSGEQVGVEITTAEYWVNHVRQPVKFAESMKTLHEEGYEVFLEIGPKPILLGMGRQCLPEDVGVWLPSLRPNKIPLPSSLERGRLEDAALLNNEWQQMLSSLGKLYAKGATVDWSEFDGDYTRQKVALPTYPFQGERYWVDTSKNQDRNTTNQSSNLVKLLNQGGIEELTQELKLSEELTEDEQKLLPKLLNILAKRQQKYLQEQDYIVGDYYDELASVLDEEAILNYIPLPGIMRGFSSILFFAKLKTQEKYHKLASTAQQEIRNIGWQKIDFSSCQKVLDIGCGHGTDLMTLGQKYNHLELCGYTISERQVELGNQKINQLNLEERLKIINGDSSQDEFPENYDLIYGFEVTCHIKKKKELFLNIRNHLNNEGNLVLSDFISNASFSIDYDAHSSYLITQQEWLDLLSQNHLKIIHYVDISNEIANGLDDPNFTENLNYICKKSNLNENARVGLQSYDNLYKMLRKKLVSYVVMTAQKQDLLSVDEIYKWNQEILQKPLHYSDVSLQQLFYRVEWQKATAKQQQKKQLQSKNWIIFSDRDGVGKRLKNLLEKRGDRCFMVFRGETYKQKETGSWELNPSNPGDFERFCQEVKITVGESLRIIHLWSLETTPSQQLTQSALESAQKYSCGSVLHLVQAMEKHWDLNSLSPQLWLITKGSQSVLPDVEEVAIAQTPLWGIGKVISLEHPQLWGGLIDLDKESSTNETEILLQLVEEDEQEDRLAIRHGEIYVARLERKLLAESQPLSLSEEGSYLITGGTGALGLSIAQWLVEKGCKHLVLTGRSQPSEQAQLKINSLQKQGSEVVVTQADVSVQEDMERVFKQVEEVMPPLKGVIHAAGVIGFHLLQELELSQLEAILRPKVVGGWLLHQLTQKLKLDFFVNFSSIASVWGSKGQAHYAAANNFLDGLTDYRQSMGLPTYSINWGAWSGGGMATGEAMNLLNQMGVKPMEPEKAIAALEKILASNSPHTVVADINWDLFKELYELGAKGSFLEEISLYSEATDGERASEKSSELLQELHQAPESERNQMLIEHLQNDVAKIIGLSKSQLPDPELGFFKMGMDSLMAVQLRNMLNSTFRSSISTATLFEKSNIKDLAEYLIAEIFPEGEEEEIDLQESQEVTPPKQIETEFEGEIDSAIASELQEIQALLKEEN
ncbi:MAG: SDR family NAD(P)-dependent oxidoreductase [Okeania sp. SIO2C9]|uniref:type I polyketide synthase n=1 Tax=Okeania sp. SIO2C9 TaxID=2607791 RepID=UPI0013BF7265|nr:type I polyketide synthase [Okeania sp. SIO2C9]NEQ72618.1 SDR family NAD(P)-dependent oxidoreductase [Okeania sp. SIO2C9]